MAAGTRTIRAFTPVFDGLWQPIERARHMGPCFRRDDKSAALEFQRPIAFLVSATTSGDIL